MILTSEWRKTKCRAVSLYFLVFGLFQPSWPSYCSLAGLILFNGGYDPTKSMLKTLLYHVLDTMMDYVNFLINVVMVATTLVNMHYTSFSFNYVAWYFCSFFMSDVTVLTVNHLWMDYMLVLLFCRGCLFVLTMLLC